MDEIFTMAGASAFNNSSPNTWHVKNVPVKFSENTFVKPVSSKSKNDLPSVFRHNIQDQ